MVKQTIESWASRIIGPLVVSAILALGGGGVVLRDVVLTLRLEVDYLRNEAEKGGRFTRRDGDRHNHMIKRLQAEISGHDERLDNHGRLQEHEGADRRMRQHDREINALIIRLNEYGEGLAEALKQINNHTQGTSGRIGRLDALERRMERAEKKEHAH